MGFINQPHKVWWRNAIFQIHLWAGAFLAVYVIVICLSGCILIFSNEITDDAPGASSQAFQVNPLALDNAVAAACQLHADYDLDSIEVARQPGKTSFVEMRKKIKVRGRSEETVRNLYFNPSTGLIVSDIDPYSRHPFYYFIKRLHMELLAGRSPGRRINGTCAGLLLLLCITGIVIWWPGRKRWKHGLSIRWGANWKRVSFDAHRAIGFWALSIISVWAITGVYFGYPIEVVLKRIIPFATSVHHPVTNWNPGDEMLSSSDLYRRAQQVFPGAEVGAIYFPSHTGDTVEVDMWRVSTRSPTFLHYGEVRLDPGNGAILQVQDQWKQGKAGDHILRVLLMLHVAGFDSLTLRIVFALLGLSPVILAITGGLMWWNRVLRKRWKELRKTKNRHAPQHESELLSLMSLSAGTDSGRDNSSAEQLAALNGDS